MQGRYAPGSLLLSMLSDHPGHSGSPGSTVLSDRAGSPARGINTLRREPDGSRLNVLFFVPVLSLVVQLFRPIQRIHAVEPDRPAAFFTEKTADVFRPVPADAAGDGVQAVVVKRMKRVEALFSVHRVILLPFVLL